MTTRPASGWYVEVATGSYTYRGPAVGVIVDDSRQPNFSPQANSRPGIRIPVREGDRWESILGDGSSDTDLDVWQDGRRVAIDTLDDVEQEPGATVLVGSGGRELETRVETSFDQKAVHSAAEDLINANTAYTANVDTPSTSTETNTTLITLTSNSDWLTRAIIPDTAPVTVSGGTINLSQTCFTQAANADRTATNNITLNNSVGGGTYANDDRFEYGSVGDWVEWEFTTDYTIPGQDFDIAAREEASGADPPTIARRIDINSTGSFQTLAEAQLGGAGLLWRTNTDFSNDVADATDIPPGTHTLRIEATGAGADTWYVDAVAPRDSGDRYGGFGYTDDNTTDGNDDLAGPELRPDEYQVKFETVAAPEAVTGIRAEATLDEGASDYTHYLSNDQGASFTSGTGSNFETDSLGADFGPGVTYKAGLSRTGTGASGTPTAGRNGTDLQSLTLKADLEDMPIVVNTTFDDSLAAILTQLANIGDQLWAYERDGSTESIEWTSPGQRTSDKDPQIGDYSATKTVGEVYQKVTVYGQPNVPVRGERFESDHGNAVALSKDRLRPNAEQVLDPDTGERFQRGPDYTMDYQAGEITVLASGDMADGEQFEIDYQYQPTGTFDDGTMNPAERTVTIAGLTTDFACEQAAQLIVNEVSSPLRTATVTVPADDPHWSVVESLNPDLVPTGGEALHVRDIVATTTPTTLTLGSRRSFDDVVADIRAQVGAVSRTA